MLNHSCVNSALHVLAEALSRGADTRVPVVSDTTPVSATWSIFDPLEGVHLTYLVTYSQPDHLGVLHLTAEESYIETGTMDDMLQAVQERIQDLEARRV